MVSFSCIFIRRNTVVGYILPRQLADYNHGSWPIYATAVGWILLLREPGNEARVDADRQPPYNAQRH